MTPVRATPRRSSRPPGETPAACLPTRRWHLFPFVNSAAFKGPRIPSSGTAVRVGGVGDFLSVLVFMANHFALASLSHTVPR